MTGLPQLEEVEYNITRHCIARTVGEKRQSIQPSSLGRTPIRIETHTETTRDDDPDTSRGSPAAENKDSLFPDIEGTAEGHGSDEIMSSTVVKLDLEWVGGMVDHIR